MELGSNERMEQLAIVTIHDACPTFSLRTFKITQELERLEIRYNIGLVPFFNGEQDLPRFPKFVEKIKDSKREILLHGLYHENRRHQNDDFEVKTKTFAEQEIRAGLQIFEEVGIHPTVFIPPCWKLNIYSIQVLEKLRFKLTEIQEKLVLICSRSFRKIAVAKVLNWDSCGDEQRNIVNVERNRTRLNLMIKEKSEIVRIALHPRDPYRAIEDQKGMISKMKDTGYQFLTYSELVPRLETKKYQSEICSLSHQRGDD
jgi:predicted deacetylase